MATDVIPSTDSCVTVTNEQEKFALNLNGKKIVRVEDEAAIEVLAQILGALGGSVAVDPTITPVTTIANTETQITLPANTIEFRLQARGDSKIFLAYNAGDIANGDHVTIWPGNCEVVSRELNQSDIFVQTSLSDTIEVHSFSRI
jgi:hypothetical protein